MWIRDKELCPPHTWHTKYQCSDCVPSKYYQLLTFPVLVCGQTLGPRQGEGEGHHRGGQQEEPGQAESRHHQQWALQGQGGEAGQRSLRAAAASQQQAPGTPGEERDSEQGYRGKHRTGSQ